MDVFVEGHVRPANSESGWVEAAAVGVAEDGTKGLLVLFRGGFVGWWPGDDAYVDDVLADGGHAIHDLGLYGGHYRGNWTLEGLE